jgi:hypothetical protein
MILESVRTKPAEEERDPEETDAKAKEDLPAAAEGVDPEQLHITTEEDHPINVTLSNGNRSVKQTIPETTPQVPPPKHSQSAKQTQHERERSQAAHAVHESVEEAKINRCSSQSTNARRMLGRYVRSLAPVPPGSIVC